MNVKSGPSLSPLANFKKRGASSGFDLVARDESNVNLRNGLFVALTRTRGWVRLSGVGEYPMCDEMRQVIAAGNSFTFTFDRPIKRNVEDD
jgi:superfamily I DNA and RNA helicase